MARRIWTCKIGSELGSLGLPSGADEPMREAVTRAFEELTGFAPEFVFSGWGGELTEPELAVVENRLPSEEHYQQWLREHPEEAPDAD